VKTKKKVWNQYPKKFYVLWPSNRIPSNQAGQIQKGGWVWGGDFSASGVCFTTDHFCCWRFFGRGKNGESYGEE